MVYIDPTTVPVPVGTIERHGTGMVGDEQACGTCGAVVAYAHVARHIAWHASAGWVQATVTRGQGQMGP